MTSFRIDEMWQVICWCEGTRYGFRHLAVLMKNGTEVFRAKCCYYNRTWERYEFQTVLRKTLIEYTDDIDKRYKTLIKQSPADDEYYKNEWKKAKEQYKPLLDYEEKV